MLAITGFLQFRKAFHIKSLASGTSRAVDAKNNGFHRFVLIGLFDGFDHGGGTHRMAAHQAAAALAGGDFPHGVDHGDLRLLRRSLLLRLHDLHQRGEGIVRIGIDLFAVVADDLALTVFEFLDQARFEFVGVGQLIDQSDFQGFLGRVGCGVDQFLHLFGGPFLGWPIVLDAFDQAFS